MFPRNNISAVLWWGFYTLIGVWAQRFVPGVDFLAPGIVVALQRDYGARTFWLAVIWILLLEGTGNLPFGYGIAWYGLLVTFYVMGRWLFEARSLLFMCLLGIGLGVLHPMLIYFLASLGNLAVPMQTTLVEGAMQAVTFPVVWLILDKFFPKGLRRDVKSL
ncbi:hypothetical protein [Pseudodesulfovibrio sp.]|uniref:hypothetical protein n=1 Tax=unclassified Pseudodesulfovibrio TaxID=2661612 RepID=UPI003AFFD085